VRIFSVWLMTLMCTAALAADNSSRRDRESYNDKYAMLSEHNIFVRDRSRPAARETATTRPTHPPEQDFVLTGIVFEAGGYHAYIEDVANARVMRLAVGEGMARGRIASIEMDAVAYDTGGKVTWINVGWDFTGHEAAPLPMPTSEPAEASTQPSTAAPEKPIDPKDPNLTPEQRMKLRRMQELKR
jgi:hypothetical protein